MHRLFLLAALVLLARPLIADEAPLKVHAVTAAKEYSATESIHKLAEYLKSRNKKRK